MLHSSPSDSNVTYTQAYPLTSQSDFQKHAGDLESLQPRVMTSRAVI